MASKADNKRLKTIRDRFKLWYDADQPQRDREVEPLRMYALEQWPDDVLKARMAQNGNGVTPATPARPCLIVDQLREPVHQIVNQERESDLAVEVIPADDFGSLEQPVDPAEIELREGLIRRIQRESESASARTWAFTRAAICGRGYYAVNTRYAEGKTFDQEVYFRRIYNQGGVLLDPAHEEPDGSDSSGGFIFTVMSYDAYKAEFPQAATGPNKYLACNDAEWTALMDEAPGWFTQEAEEKYVRVAEHWYTEFTSRMLCEMPDGSSVWQDELPEGIEPRSKRAVVEKSVKWCKLDGCQLLDETDWPSPYVPIVKVVGNEIPPSGDERLVDGIINKSAIESQRGRNYMVSKLVEEIGLSAVSPLIVEEGTIEGYEAWWNQSNTRAFAYLPWKSTNLEGQRAQAPHRPDKSVSIAPMAQAMQLFQQSIQMSTGVTDPQMGRPNGNSQTWRGTQALITQGQRGTSNYMDNFSRSVRYDGRIVNSLLYPIYGIRPGRLARIVKGEGESETVPIGVPFVMAPNGQGKEAPAPAPPGATPDQGGVREYKLTKQGDSANVAIKVTKGYDTRRQEEAAVLGEMVGSNPQMFLPVMGDLYFNSQDWPGAKEAAERMKVMLDPKVQAMIDQKKGGQAAIPPQVMQQMQQMQQQGQQMQQALQQMQTELQSGMQVAQLKAQTEERIAMLKAQTEIEAQRMKLENDRMIAGAKLQGEDARTLAKLDADMQKQQIAHNQEIETALLEAELAPQQTEIVTTD